MTLCVLWTQQGPNPYPGPTQPAEQTQNFKWVSSRTQGSWEWPALRSMCSGTRPQHYLQDPTRGPVPHAHMATLKAEGWLSWVQALPQSPGQVRGALCLLWPLGRVTETEEKVPRGSVCGSDFLKGLTA